MPASKSASPTGRVGIPLLIVAVVGNVLLGSALVWAAVLRETPDFWTNEGGYPVALRFLVRFLFFPLWLSVGLLTLGVLGRGISGLRRSSPLAVLTLLAGVLHLLLLLTATTIAFWNNVHNLATGMPLHSHP